MGSYGYILENTFVANSAVTRGICDIRNGKIERIIETKNIVFDGKIASSAGNVIPSDSVVSMNFWMFPKEFVKTLDDKFKVFRSMLRDVVSEEFLLPTIVDGLLREGEYSCEAIATDAKCFGVTRKEDIPVVAEALARLI